MGIISEYSLNKLDQKHLFHFKSKILALDKFRWFFDSYLHLNLKLSLKGNRLFQLLFQMLKKQNQSTGFAKRWYWLAFKQKDSFKQVICIKYGQQHNLNLNIWKVYQESNQNIQHKHSSHLHIFHLDTNTLLSYIHCTQGILLSIPHQCKAILLKHKLA